MITISLCMIVKDEEKHLRKCLDSVKDVVDEIVIVDTGSTDQTKEIAREYTDKVYDFEWIDDFAAARNESFSHGTMDYLMWLDADDILLKKDCEKLKVLKEKMPPGIDRVMFYYNYSFDSQGKPALTFKRERLVKREKNYKWVGYIHEVIETSGVGLDTDIYVTHTRDHGIGDRNLKIFQKHVDNGETLSPRNQYYYAKELFYLGMYDKALPELIKFLENPSWEEDILDAINRIGDIFIMREEYKTARDMLLQAFDVTIPRAETLYRIAYTYEKERRYDLAIYWFELIGNLEKPNTPGFLFEEYWTWRPWLELSVCYDHVGKSKLAMEYNEKAAALVPDHKAVINNQKYFNKLKKEGKLK